MLQDVYTEIAQLVQKRVDEDEARGIPEATVLRDNVDRKLVKQTVMTSVYGVTFVGARHQIGNRLRERGWEDDRLVYKASCYGARVSPHICMHHSFSTDTAEKGCDCKPCSVLNSAGHRW